MFLKKSFIEPYKYLGINKYNINLEKYKSQLYKLIYSFKPIKFKIFKT